MVKNTKMPLCPWFTELSVNFHEKSFSVQEDNFFKGCEVGRTSLMRVLSTSHVSFDVRFARVCVYILVFVKNAN